jgi:uncharacterized repeat protein (TIGR03803 family)
MVLASNPVLGAGIALLHEFTTGTDDGSSPFYTRLAMSGSTVYGMTLYGGGSSYGTVFSMGTDGSSFDLLHEFTGSVDDGREPYGSLTLSGTTLYGMTRRGGDDDLGTVFSIGVDGSGFIPLHEFAGGADDGQGPYGSLTLSGSTLYGQLQAAA